MPEGFVPALSGPTRRDFLTLVPACGACKLLQGCKTPKMPVDGGGRKRIMVIGEAPGQSEDLQGRPFVGKAGQYLMRCMDGTGIDLRRDCWVTNSLWCRPPRNVIDDDRKIDYCRPNVAKAIREHKPEVIVLLGLSAVKSVIGWLWKDDVGPMQRWAGWQIPSQELNAWVCATYHPSHVMRDEEDRKGPSVLKLLFQRHLHDAFALEGRPWGEVPDYKAQVEVVRSPTEAAERLHQFGKRNAPFSFDFETTTLKPDGPHAAIYSCAVSDGRTALSFPWAKPTKEAMAVLLASETPKIGYNAKFEDRWTRKEFGFGVRNWLHDGMLAAHVLDNRPQVTGLKFQAFVKLGVGGYDQAIKPYLVSKGSNLPNRINDAPIQKVLEYGGMDAVLEYHVGRMQVEELNG